jgi:hypothetical protein
VTQTVVSICRHGAAKSRLAALFNRMTPHGRHAITAGLQPRDEVSPKRIVQMSNVEC